MWGVFCHHPQKPKKPRERGDRTEKRKKDQEKGRKVAVSASVGSFCFLMCMYVHMCTCMWKDMQCEARGTFTRYLPLSFSTLFLDRLSHWPWSSLTGQQTPKSSCLHILSPGVIVCAATPSFLMWVPGFELRSRSPCWGDTLLMAISLSFPHSFHLCPPSFLLASSFGAFGWQT